MKLVRKHFDFESNSYIFIPTHVELIFYLFPSQTAAAKAPVKGASKDKTKNIMRDLKIRKLCLNICVGESGDRLTRAAKVKY